MSESNEMMEGDSSERMTMSPFPKGARVEMHGLVLHPEWNGRTAVVQSGLRKDGERQTVEFDEPLPGSPARVNVRPRHMRLLDSEDSDWLAPAEEAACAASAAAWAPAPAPVPAPAAPAPALLTPAPKPKPVRKARGGAGAASSDSAEREWEEEQAAEERRQREWEEEEAALAAEARVEAAMEVAATATVKTHVPVRALKKGVEEVGKYEVYSMLVQAKEAGKIEGLGEVSILTLKRLWTMCAWKEWEPYRRNTPGCNSRIDLELFVEDAVKSGCVFEPTKARNSHLKAWREKYEALLETYSSED